MEKKIFMTLRKGKGKISLIRHKNIKSLKKMRNRIVKACTVFCLFVCLFLFVCLSFCCFFGPLLRHMEVPRLGVQSEL